ncbi:MAG TPA: hypothetical protein VMG08_18365 [Allosphingosinicella sp.]|nr:hypothetical protein [Allosphingosinicella sp.]
MIDLGRQIGFGDFKHRVGKVFAVAAAGQEVPVKLRACQALPGSKRDGGGFRLEFAGPLAPLLGQGVFEFRIDHDHYGIFIVPIGQSERSMRYEAIYF